MQIPQHLAIILDGNGRWAEKRFLPRVVGHRQGAKNVKNIVASCRKVGVRYLTLYAFSTENWKRPKMEVNALMKLLVQFLGNELPGMLDQDIRFNMIGDMTDLPARAQAAVQDAMRKTAQKKAMVLTLALSYGGRDEIVRAVRHLAAEVRAGDLSPEQIDENIFSGTLDTGNMPDPDFLIRTSGEKRISNFLLWQLAYTEMFFSEVFWPDFGEKELFHAFEEFGRRQRRFGLTWPQVVPGHQAEGR